MIHWWLVSLMYDMNTRGRGPGSGQVALYDHERAISELAISEEEAHRKMSLWKLKVQVSLEPLGAVG